MFQSSSTPFAAVFDAEIGVRGISILGRREKAPKTPLMMSRGGLESGRD
jgi:hypothetical protein